MVGGVLCGDDGFYLVLVIFCFGEFFISVIFSDINVVVCFDVSENVFFLLLIFLGN